MLMAAPPLQYAAEDRCWAFGSTYMVCEVCVGSAEAMHPGPLVELRSPSILGNSHRLGSKWGRALARGAVRCALDCTGLHWIGMDWT